MSSFRRSMTLLATYLRADHIIVLKNGKMETEGTLDDVLGTSKEIQRLCHGHGEREGPGASMLSREG